MVMGKRVRESWNLLGWFRKMIFFEPQCIGFAHAEINAAYILLYRKAFPSDKIEFYGEVEHLKKVEEVLSFYAMDISYVPIEIPRGGQSYLKRFITEFQNVRIILRSARENKSNALLLSVTSATLLAVKIFGYGLKQKIFIVVHGILETIVKKPDGLLARLFWFKRYFVSKNLSNVQYILNGSFIETNVLALFPTLRSHVRSLELPYFFENTIHGISGNDVLKPVFASAGVAALSKGSNYFFNLAKDVIKNHGIKNITFSYIGHFVDPGMEQFNNGYVMLPSKDHPLEKEEFQKLMMNADFFVFFYPKDSYKFGVSGVFFDAVKFEKPIIAIRNDFFSYYFDKYGDLGWLCNDYAEVLDLVIKLSKHVEANECARFATNYKKIKSDLSMNKQVINLQNILN